MQRVSHNVDSFIIPGLCHIKDKFVFLDYHAITIAIRIAAKRAGISEQVDA